MPSGFAPPDKPDSGTRRFKPYILTRIASGEPYTPALLFLRLRFGLVLKLPLIFTFRMLPIQIIC